MTPLRKAYRDVTAQAVVVLQRLLEYRRLEAETRTWDGFGTFGRSCAFGGFEIALAADVEVCTDTAEFCRPEMQWGFVGDAGAIQRLPRKFPYNVAVELLLTGRRMGAQEAVRWGFAHQAVPQSELMAKARELAGSIAKGALLAARTLLEALPVVDRLPVEEAFARTKRGCSGLTAYERMLTSEDFLEGPRAFAEKRKPVWKER